MNVVPVIVTLARWLLAPAIGYVLGSILPAALLARLHGVDLARVGDGNPGTINAFRGLGAVDGIITLVYDATVGIVSVLIASKLLAAPDAVAYLAGIAAIAGHRFPLFPESRPGGQGMAASAGLLVYGLIVATLRGWMPPLAWLLLIALVATVLAVTRSGMAVSLIALPFAITELLVTRADWPLVALVALVIGHIWLVQAHRARKRSREQAGERALARAGYRR